MAAVTDATLVIGAGMNPYWVTGLTAIIGGGLALVTDGALHDFFKGAAVAGGASLVTTGAADVAAKVAAARARAQQAAAQVQPKQPAVEPKRNAPAFTEEDAARLLTQAKALAERAEATRTDGSERRQAGNLIPMPVAWARNYGGGKLYLRPVSVATA